MKRLWPVCLLLALVLALGSTSALADQGGEEEVTILFTHDMHSAFLPREDGTGGYARLKTVIDRQREAHPDALVLDGGDFSMGSLFQTAYATAALELRAMGLMGYDVTTFGNHEFDYRASGLSAMLLSALDSGDPLPALVNSNYLPPEEDGETWSALEAYGVEEYVLLERGDVPFLIFGLTGLDSDECAPMSGMILSDPVETARRVVEEGTAQALEVYGEEPVVICLSHSGTVEGKGEDYDLARKVEGIDIIVSGHSHTLLEEPLVVGGTYIVSAGENANHLGSITLTRQEGELTLTDYQLLPVDQAVPEDGEMAAWIEAAKEQVEADYLSQFGLKFDQVLAENSCRFDTVDQVYATQHESTLGNLLSDAYAWMARQTDSRGADVALTASGVIRDTLPLGPITVSQVFNTTSLGIGADGVPGYPLIGVYLTGADLKNALEVDASVTPLMPAAQLFFSGVEYSFNTNRMIFDKVDSAMIRLEDGTIQPLEDDKLYRVVTGLYIGQMLGAVEDTSFGILTVTPRDENGTPIEMDRLEDYILHDEQGGEIKEWYAVAAYLQSMGGSIDGQYSQPDGRKLVYSSWNPIHLLKNAGLPTLLAVLVLLVLVCILVGIVMLVRKRIRRRKSTVNAKEVKIQQ